MNHSAATPRWSPQLVQAVCSADVSLAAAATMLADNGIPAFPCAPGQKYPLTPHGFHDASSDRGVVASWWKRWPEANIGIPTGATSGVDVVDVDVHSGGDGYRAFSRAEGLGIVSDWAWQVRTPSGGLHAYFLRWSAGEQRSWALPGSHVDFRGDGGYVVAPPSHVVARDGVDRRYELAAITDHQPHEVNGAALRNFLDPPRRHGPPRDLPSNAHRPEKLADWVASRPEGGRNEGLFWAACRMAEANFPFATTAHVLGDAAKVAGLPEHEATTTIRSAYRIATRLGPAQPSGPTRAVEEVRL